MNAENWTELTSAYGATFTPKVAPERNVLPAVVDLNTRVAALEANTTGSFTTLTTGALTATGNVLLGNATTDLVGFYGAAGTDQGAAITNASVDAASAIAQLNLLLARVRELGLIAT